MSWPVVRFTIYAFCAVAFCGAGYLFINDDRYTDLYTGVGIGICMVVAGLMAYDHARKTGARLPGKDRGTAE